MIAVHPGQRLRKMLRGRFVVFENDFQLSGSAVQSDTVRKTRKSALVGGVRNRQFSITLLVSAECQKVVGSSIRLRGIFVRWLLTCPDPVMTDEVIFAFCMPQKYAASFIP